MAVENFISVLGLKRILGVQPLKIVKKDITNALNLSDTISDMTLDFLKDRSPTVTSTLTMDDMKWIKPAVENFDSAAMMQTVLPQLSSLDVDEGVAGKIAELVSYLQEALPKNDQLTGGLISSKAPSSSFSDNAKFLWVCRLIDNPLHLITLMQLKQVTKYDVTTVKETYPDIYQSTIDFTIENTLETFTITDSIPRQVRMMMSVLLQLPILDAKSVRAYSENPDPKPIQSSDRAPNIALEEA